MTGFPDIGIPSGGQSHKRGKVGVVGSAKSSDDRTHGGISSSVLIIVGTSCEGISRLHGNRRVITCLAIHRSQKRELIGNARLQRQMLAEKNPGCFRGDGRIGATNFCRGGRFRVPHIQMTGATRKPEEDHRLFVARRSWPRFCCRQILELEDLGERQPGHSG